MSKSITIGIVALGLLFTIIILTKLFWYSIIALVIIVGAICFFKSDVYQKYSK